jgi:cell division protein FtsL
MLGKKMAMSGVLIGQDVKTRRDLNDMSYLYSVLFFVLVSVLVLFGYLWARITVVQTGYAISKANTERSALVERNRRLKIDYARLKSPERIEKIASTELNLARPKAEQIVTLK